MSIKRKKLYKWVLARCKERLGPRHPYTLLIRRNMARVLEAEDTGNEGTNVQGQYMLPSSIAEC
jgi:hypothetical protein